MSTASLTLLDTIEPATATTEPATSTGDSLLLSVSELAGAHDRHEAERSDITSSQNSAGDDGENRDLNLPKN